MALRDQPYLPLYVDDYLTDEKLNMCSASTQGVYIKILCLMHKSEPYGTILLKQKDKQSVKQLENFACKLARLLPFQTSEIEAALTDLIEEEVIQLDGDSIVQKRMVKDNSISVSRSRAGKEGGESTQRKLKTFAKAKRKANSVNVSEDENGVDLVINNSIDFEIFWNLYDKREGRATVKYKWDHIAFEDQSAIIEHVPKYVAATPDKKYRKLPLTYLNQKTWLDEDVPSLPMVNGVRQKPETPEERDARIYMETVKAYNTHKTLYGEQSANEKFNMNNGDIQPNIDNHRLT